MVGSSENGGDDWHARTPFLAINAIRIRSGLDVRFAGNWVSLRLIKTYSFWHGCFSPVKPFNLAMNS